MHPNIRTIVITCQLQRKGQYYRQAKAVAASAMRSVSVGRVATAALGEVAASSAERRDAAAPHALAHDSHSRHTSHALLATAW